MLSQTDVEWKKLVAIFRGAGMNPLSERRTYFCCDLITPHSRAPKF